MKISIKQFGIAGVVGLALAGCVETEIDTVSATVTGTVVDATSVTGTPLQDVEVAMTWNGELHTTRTDANGNFAFGGVPFVDANSDQGHVLTISGAEGYAGAEREVWIDAPDARAKVTRNLGRIGLSPTMTLNVNVTENGALVSHAAPVVALAHGDNGACYNYEGDAADVTAETVSGSAALTLAKCATYDLLVPAHGNSDTLPAKYTTTLFDNGAGWYLYNPMGGQTTVAIGIEQAEPSVGLAVVSQSVSDNDVWFNAYYSTDAVRNTYVGIVSADYQMVHSDTIKMVFNYPVSLVNGVVDVAYTDILVDDTGGTLNKIIAATAELDSTGTILTVSIPSTEWADIKTHSRLALSGVVEADGDVLGIARSIYVQGGALSSDAIKAVNYADAAIDAQVRLVFPDYVEGYATLTSYQIDNTTTEVANNVYAIDTDELVNAEAACSQCGPAGRSARVNLFTQTGLPVLKDGDKFTMILDVEDAKGNRIQETKTFTVQ